jgi:hypothetical protein
LTLAFYSLKAYNYVRRTFHLALPHPSTLRQWFQGVNGQPGFTEEAFKALSVRVEKAKLYLFSLTNDKGLPMYQNGELHSLA